MPTVTLVPSGRTFEAPAVFNLQRMDDKTKDPLKALLARSEALDDDLALHFHARRGVLDRRAFVTVALCDVAISGQARGR